MRSWSIVDFVLVWVGGILGAGIFLGLGELVDAGAWLLMVSLAGQYLGYTVVLLLIARNRDTSDLGLSIETKDLRYLALGVFLQLLVAMLLQPLAETLLPEGGQPQQIIERITGPDASTLLKITFFSAAVVLTPLFEELIFRGVLLRAIVSRGRTLAMVATSVVFAAVHIRNLDLENLAASMALAMPPLLLLALLLAWITLRNERLGPAIFLHSGWNLLAAIVVLIPTELLEGVN